MRLILASASPRRAELLRAAGFPFETCAVDVDERVHAGETAASYVRRLAAEKSALAAIAVRGPAREGPAKVGRHVQNGPAEAGRHGQEGPAKAGHYVQTHNVQTHPPSTAQQVVVLGADTAVVIDGEILGKPRDNGDAAAMLRRLSGRRHDVMTGVSVRVGVQEVGRVETTAVYFVPLSPAEIAWYVASGEGRDKAGAYAAQGLASRFIPRIEGSYSNVVGLPLGCVYELLKELGVDYSGGQSGSGKSL